MACPQVAAGVFPEMWFVCAFGTSCTSPRWTLATTRSKGELAMAIISSRRRHRVPLWGAIVLAGTALADMLSAAPAGALAATQPPAASAATSFAVNGFFNGVTATSASAAWAVGGNNGNTLIAHWNGTAWKHVPSPDPSAQYTVLYSVAAISATNAWAVGTADFSPLILHWNGTKWQQVPSPASPGDDVLYGVAATSATNAWAVGSDSVNGTLSFHWNGTTWAQTPGPSASLDSFSGVAATSATNAWAAGSAGNSTLIAHWNGTAWKQVPSPNPTKEKVHALNGVAATSATNAWAVGYNSTLSGGGQRTLIAHWNG